MELPTETEENSLKRKHFKDFLISGKEFSISRSKYIASAFDLKYGHTERR